MIKRIICIVLIAALAIPLVGCQTDRGTTVAQGAGAGAIIGALFGAVVGGRNGALIGAALGAAGGAAVGVHVANRKAQYASTEDYLDACIASAHQTNQQMRAYNAQLSGQIAQLDAETARLLSRYRSKQVTKSRLLKKRKVVRRKLKEAKAKLARLQKEISIQQKVLAQERGKAKGRLAKLQAELQELRKTAAELERQTSQLAALDTRMNV